MRYVEGVAGSDKFPKIGRVVHLDSVAEFVYQDIVDEFKRKAHKGNIEADRAITTATPPSSARVRES